MFKFLNPKYPALLMFFLGTQQALFAAGPPKPSSMSNPVVLTLVFIMAILLLAIVLLGNILIGATEYKYNLKKKIAAAGKTTGIVAVVLFSLIPVLGYANDTEAVEAASTGIRWMIDGVSPLAFYLILGVIAVELIVLFTLLLQLRQVIISTRKEEIAEVQLAEKPAEKFAGFKIWWSKTWTKLNSFRSKEEEQALEMEHDYDGIRELDNTLPPWWLYGFYLSILVAGIYMWRYHVAETAPLSEQEFQIAWAKGEAQVAEYLKNSAANVDENTITLITDPAALNAAQALFVQNCQACHGAVGEGNAVGPNLTDDYWLHGGSLSDVFKSIKYGWPDKGMKSWKDDFSPVQIAQLTGYIKSLRGTNPPNARDPQGELYIEEENSEPAEAAIEEATAGN